LIASGDMNDLSREDHERRFREMEDEIRTGLSPNASWQEVTEAFEPARLYYMKYLYSDEERTAQMNPEPFRMD
jgi:hypothetical protein